MEALAIVAAVLGGAGAVYTALERFVHVAALSYVPVVLCVGSGLTSLTGAPPLPFRPNGIAPLTATRAAAVIRACTADVYQQGDLFQVVLGLAAAFALASIPFALLNRCSAAWVRPSQPPQPQESAAGKGTTAKDPDAAAAAAAAP
eukprot:m51a1_g7800 hypothetical protein (146) ;mRNA; f:59773-60210